MESKKLWVLDIRVDYGFSKTEEIIDSIARMAIAYRPHLCIVEYDAQQKGIGNDDRLSALGAIQGFQVQPHLTRQNKGIDQVFGVAAMNQSFVKGEVSIPWGDENTKRRMDALVHQLRAWRPDVPTKKLRQDAVMSLWFCWRYWMSTREAHRAPAERPWRPAFMEGPQKRPVLL